MSMPPTLPTARLLYRTRHSALELSWLARRERQLPVPAVLYVADLSVGGYYVWPSSGVQYVEGIEVPPGRGTIIASVEREILTLEAVLAHEWSHHVAFWNGQKYEVPRWRPPATAADQSRAFRDYFTSSRSELSALRYQTRHARDEGSRWLLSLCTPPDSTSF